MTEGHRKRRQFFIHRGVQYRFIAWVVLLTLIFAIGASWIAYYVVWSQILELAVLRGEADKLFMHITQGFLWSMITTSVIGGGLGAMIGLIVSHKIAGPVYRFGRVAQDLAKGTPISRFKLRKGDELQEMAEEFNEVIDTVNRLRTQSQSLKDKLTEIKKEVEREPTTRTISKEKLENILDERRDEP